MPRFYRFNYSILNNEGVVVDSSDGGEAISFVEGDNDTIIGLQEALAGRSVGEEFSVTIEPGEAYGFSKRSLIRNISREMFDADDLAVGMIFQVGAGGDGEVARVVEVSDEHVTIDSNHPLAGVTFNFDIKVLEAREASAEELEVMNAKRPPSRPGLS
ncbi:MAG: peptidylprolyl isomerase [Pseudomonadales bacterium]